VHYQHNESGICCGVIFRILFYFCLSCRRTGAAEREEGGKREKEEEKKRKKDRSRNNKPHRFQQEEMASNPRRQVCTGRRTNYL
jgi:hypothetical protein